MAHFTWSCCKLVNTTFTNFLLVMWNLLVIFHKWLSEKTISLQCKQEQVVPGTTNPAPPAVVLADWTVTLQTLKTHRCYCPCLSFSKVDKCGMNHTGSFTVTLLTNRQTHQKQYPVPRWGRGGGQGNQGQRNPSNGFNVLVRQWYLTSSLCEGGSC